MTPRARWARWSRLTASGALLLMGCAQARGARNGDSTRDATTRDASTVASAREDDDRAVGTRAANERAPETTPHASHSREASVGSRNGDLHLLAVSGFENAVVVVPPGEHRMPLLVATHGAGGDPSFECERWARAARGRWFVACPRGFPLRRGEAGSYYYPDHPTLEREVLAVVRAVHSAYAARVSESDGVYLGYSQGATMGALMVVEHGALFPHLVLIEGGSGDWTLKRAERFRATGGRSVFIICGTPTCSQRAAASARTLERAGLDAATRYAEGGGHTELGSVGTEAEALLETLAIPGS